MMPEPVAPILPPNPIPDLGSRDAVTSVNGETGAVVLDAADVGAAEEAVLASYVAAAQISGSGMGVVVHGSNADAPRPSGYAIVTWVGTVDPNNGVDGDILYKPPAA